MKEKCASGTKFPFYDFEYNWRAHRGVGEWSRQSARYYILQNQSVSASKTFAGRTLRLKSRERDSKVVMHVIQNDPFLCNSASHIRWRCLQMFSPFSNFTLIRSKRTQTRWSKKPSRLGYQGLNDSEKV